jgi:hypothetical protein
MKLLFALLTLATLAACTKPVATEPAPPQRQASRPAADVEGRKYIAALVQAIRDADRIVVTEHSDPMDLFDGDAHESLIPDDVVYATRVLNAQQKSILIGILQGLDPATQDAFTACIPEQHHAIAFEGGKGPNTVMEICFQCGQIDWPGAVATQPWSLVGGLSTFVSTLGMQPKQDWSERAKAYQKAHQSRPATGA